MWREKRIRQHHSSVESGFTLIELLVVIVILGILSTIAVIGVSQVRTSAIKNACITSAQNLAAALESYNADHSQYPTGSTFPATLNSSTSTPTEVSTALAPYLSGVLPAFNVNGTQPFWLRVATTTSSFSITGSLKGQAGSSISLAATSGTLGSNTVGFASTTGVAVGQPVTGIGIPASTTVTSVTSTAVTLSKNLTSTASGDYTFTPSGIDGCSVSS